MTKELGSARVFEWPADETIAGAESVFVSDGIEVSAALSSGLEIPCSCMCVIQLAML
jgi:hypothetical protein